MFRADNALSAAPKITLEGDAGRIIDATEALFMG
jgi:hypothetical protein